MGLFDRVKTVVSSKAWTGHAEWLAKRIDPSPDPAPPPFAAESTYLRVWLESVRLSHSQKWFTEWHPVVHAAVARNYGNTTDEYVSVIGPAAIPGFEGAADASVTTHKALTPLLPFRGGTVSLNVGLVAAKGDNTVRTLIDIVGGFGTLVSAGSLAAGTTIATRLVDAMEALLGLGGDVGTLAYDTTMANGGGGSMTLTPDYLAVLDTEPAAPLWLQNKQLISWPGHGPSLPVAGSYLLLWLESRTQRDDWRSLSAIEEPMFAARRAIDPETRRSHYQQAIIAAKTSPDLHETDRNVCAAALQAERNSDVGFGAVDGLPADLKGVVEASPLRPEDALIAKPSLAELLA